MDDKIVRKYPSSRQINRYAMEENEKNKNTRTKNL